MYLRVCTRECVHNLINLLLCAVQGCGAAVQCHREAQKHDASEAVGVPQCDGSGEGVGRHREGSVYGYPEAARQEGEGGNGGQRKEGEGRGGWYEGGE